jgi:hypothetical protein
VPFYRSIPLIKYPDRIKLADLLSNYVSLRPGEPQAIFDHILSRANLPPRWRRQFAGTWTGDTDIDALVLVDWAIGRGTNPEDPSMTTLGSILTPLLQDKELGLEEASTIVAIIYAYGLYR